jgi:hypothetical protein
MQLEGAKLYGRTQVRGAAGKRIWMTEFGWTAEFGVALRAAEKRWNAVPQFRGVAVAPGGEVILRLFMRTSVYFLWKITKENNVQGGARHEFTAGG